MWQQVYQLLCQIQHQIQYQIHFLPPSLPPQHHQSLPYLHPLISHFGREQSAVSLPYLCGFLAHSSLPDRPECLHTLFHLILLIWAADWRSRPYHHLYVPKYCCHFRDRVIWMGLCIIVDTPFGGPLSGSFIITPISIAYSSIEKVSLFIRDTACMFFWTPLVISKHESRW